MHCLLERNKPKTRERRCAGSLVRKFIYERRSPRLALTHNHLGRRRVICIPKHTNAHQKSAELSHTREVANFCAERCREQKVRSAANVCQLESCSSAAEAGVARRIAAASQRKTRLPPPSPVTTTNECRGKVDPGGRRSRNTTTVASSTSTLLLLVPPTTTLCASSAWPPPTRPSSPPNTVWIHSTSRVSTLCYCSVTN